MKENPQAEVLRGAPLDRWIALNDDETRIVGIGETLEEAAAAATKNGVEDPIMMRTPEDWNPRIY